MKVRRVVLSSLVVLAVAGAIACCPECPDCPECPPSPEITPKTVGEIPIATRYVVIVPPEDGKRQCRIIPDPRLLEKTQSLTFVNLSGEMILIALPPALFGTDKTIVLKNEDASPSFPLVDPKPGDYIYSATGGTPDGCLTDLPTPKIVIP